MWDRTVDVLQGRTGILAAIAILYIFVPGVVSGLVRALATPGSALAIASGLVALLTGILLICGMLALTAVASDPTVDRATGSAIAWRRLPAALGVLALLFLAVAIAIAPIMLLLFKSGAVYNPGTGRFDMTRADPSMGMWAGLLSILFLVVGLWISAKLAPLFAVIVNERLGLGAFARSFRLTRGAALRLVGVLILYGIVTIVLVWAVTMVVGVVARLLLGGDAPVALAFVIGIANAVVTCLATVVQTVFYAQFYVAARDASEGYDPVA